MPRIPKIVVCDNESALKNLNHPDVRPGPAYYPQAQSKVERFHREIGKPSRTHRTTPDRVHGDSLQRRHRSGGSSGCDSG